MTQPLRPAKRTGPRFAHHLPAISGISQFDLGDIRNEVAKILNLAAKGAGIGICFVIDVNADGPYT